MATAICEILLTIEKQMKIEDVRIKAVGMILGCTRIVISSRGRRPAPVRPPKAMSFIRRSRLLPWRLAEWNLIKIEKFIYWHLTTLRKFLDADSNFQSFSLIFNLKCSHLVISPIKKWMKIKFLNLSILSLRRLAQPT